ncbi:NAD(P)-binding protein [Kingella negevensis]|uniref:NAD(P)-binding protein n=1 Tax=Kingella negevensis TaxID=1522312 RepID=UPI002551C279|nr:NAD(P)-binding protein [Kingella negevensis]MDK4681000.1 NAD(P)-binding protein [Kingella negevensis]MDK4683202.1 NAD(P)-binding protein [Kingella negevensis]MDK4691666.1 NAD(P)-binding protein [Kingella negevensis]MDK4693182.1 NAD(P)-binding protein [Kingella negevensis]MDK4699483.1 NAD(P)-binding protein [Kingella negevensis]
MSQKNKMTRRRFLSSSAVLAGASLISGCKEPIYRPVSVASAETTISNRPYYPPALTGLRGDNDGSQNHAHGVALRGKNHTLPEKISEQYDLVVVGSGISGLSAAYYYQKAQPQAKILIIDNHADFGGHAIRNEFTVDGKQLITYGGSENVDSPETKYSEVASQLLRELGIDYKKFNQYFDQTLYKEKWQLKRGTYLAEKTFGKAAMIIGQTDVRNKDNAEIIAKFPFSEEDKRALTEIYTKPQDYLKGKSKRQRQKYAETTSYKTFLAERVKLSETSLKYLQNLSSDYWGHDISAISVSEALENHYPGVQNLGLPKPDFDPDAEPYIYHFPDGNASIARLLVHKMIPNITQDKADTMEDIVTAKFQYDQLDLPTNNVRIRLNTTALLLENKDDGVAVACMEKDKQDLYRIQAKKCIYAGFAPLAARLIKEMPEAQKTAMLSGVRIPMIYTKVALKNAHAFKKLGIYAFYMPDQPYCGMMLDFSVNMGNYRAPQTPDEPIVLHMIGIRTALDGSTARDKYRAGRRQLASQSQDTLKQEVIEQLRPIYALAGENVDDAIADMTINRWAHGYSYEQVGLFDSDEATESTTKTMQKSVGNIYLANSDVAWMPYVQNAIDQGHRAAQEASKQKTA